MSRPFAVMGFSYLSAIFAASVCGEKIAGILFLVASAAFAMLIFFHIFGHKKIVLSVTALGCVAFALFSYLFSYNTRVAPAQRLNASAAIVSCTITEVKNYGGSWCYTCENENAVSESENIDSHFKFLLKTYTPISASQGDKLYANLIFSEFDDEPGLSAKASYIAEGIYLKAELDSDKTEYEVVKNAELSPFLQTEKLNRFFGDKLYSDLPLYSAKLSDAMLLGNYDRLSDSVYQSFSDSGAAHLLVVSGLHLSVVSAFVTLLLGLLKIPRRAVSLITILFVVVFMGLTGFRLSVVRAGLMYVIFMLCTVLGRESDSVNSLGFAALVICLSNPFVGGDIGFLLSFLATLGINLFSNPIAEFFVRALSRAPRLMSVLKPPIYAAAVSVSASAAVLPITVLSGQSGTFYSIFSALVLSIPSSAVIIIGMIICLFGGILSPLLVIPEMLSSLMCRFMLWYVRAFSSLPQFKLNFLAPFAVITIIIIFAIVLMSRKRRVVLVSLICCAAIFVSSGVMESLYVGRGESLIYTQTQSGFSAALVKNGSAVIVTCDTWGYYKMKQALENINCKNVRMVVRMSTSSETMWKAMGKNVTAQELADGEICGDKSGTRVTANFNGKKVVFDASKSEREKVCADICIEKYKSDDIISGFTITHESDIINNNSRAFSNLIAGKYILGSDDAVVWMKFDDDGDISVLSL